jgi:hypothetical protein
MIYYHNCDKFKGQIKNGKLNGKGIFIKKNFEKYTGNWLNNKNHGRGIYMVKNMRENLKKVKRMVKEFIYIF